MVRSRLRSGRRRRAPLRAGTEASRQAVWTRRWRGSNALRRAATPTPCTGQPTPLHIRGVEMRPCAGSSAPAVACGSDALEAAARLLAAEGRLDEALDWVERAAADGRRSVLRWAADQLVSARRLDDALAWYERAAAGGDTNAARKAGPNSGGRHASAKHSSGSSAQPLTGGALRCFVGLLISWCRRGAWMTRFPGTSEPPPRAIPTHYQVAAGQLARTGRKEESLAWFWRAADVGVSLSSGWFPALRLELLGDAADVLLRYGRNVWGVLPTDGGWPLSREVVTSRPISNPLFQQCQAM